MESVDRNQTWMLVDLPKDSKTIGCRWVKTRLAAKGYAQTECIDYNNQAYVYSNIVGDSSSV